MNTVLTEEERALQMIYKEYADERIRPHTLEIDKGLFSVEPLLKEMHELGFCRIVIPKEYGGSAAAMFTMFLPLRSLPRPAARSRNPFPVRPTCASPFSTTAPRSRSRNTLFLG